MLPRKPVHSARLSRLSQVANAIIVSPAEIPAAGPLSLVLGPALLEVLVPWLGKPARAGFVLQCQRPSLESELQLSWASHGEASLRASLNDVSAVMVRRRGQVLPGLNCTVQQVFFEGMTETRSSEISREVRINDSFLEC